MHVSSRRAVSSAQLPSKSWCLECRPEMPVFEELHLSADAAPDKRRRLPGPQSHPSARFLTASPGQRRIGGFPLRRGGRGGRHRDRPLSAHPGRTAREPR